MKVLCNQEKFSKAIQIVERIVGKKESLPVLSCILLEAKEKKLIIKATNLETGIEIVVPAEINEDGIVAIPVGILSQTIRTISGEKINLSVSEDGNLTINTKHSNTTIKNVSSDEFPSIPKETTTTSHKIPKNVLIDGIHSVSYSASVSMIRPELASIFISYSGNKLVFAATDSFRLAEKTIPVKLSGEFPDILIPVKNSLELIHVLGSVDDEVVECRFDESQLSITIGSVYFVSRIIDATFPQYQAIIPKEFSSEAIVLKGDLNNLIKKARIFSNTSQQISFHIYPSKKQFTTTARTADIGETSDAIESALSGEDLDINFNLHYLSDCFQSIQSDSVSMQFGGVGKPLVIKGISDDSFLYLAMPLNR